MTPLSSLDWAFGDCIKVPFPGTPDTKNVCLKGGFDPKYLYELTYKAKDPLVLGIGFAATRDIVSFFRNATKDSSDNPNPLAGRVSRVIAQRSSQSGNYVKSFIHLGFNQDEANRTVHVADVDAFWNHLKEKGFDPEIQRDGSWGERYFHMPDPDGHELSFARPLQ
jgi:hypothetical protein